MSRNRNISRLLIALLVGGAGLVAAPAFQSSSSVVLAQDNGDYNAKLTNDVKSRLNGKNYKDIVIRASSDGTVTLSGQVDLYGYKVDAVKRAKKAKGVKDVRDNIAVGGPTIPDDVLQHKLLGRIEVDRVGFGQVFDAISVHVQNGVVTLGGHAVGPVAQQSAVSLASYTPGVKQVVNQISVDPVSPMDNGIRVRVYRAIYGYPALRQYAIVPSKPIRISVQNGHVTLYGIVNNQMDKQLAYTRAMQVPNVFSVTNDLVVENRGGNK